MGNPVKAAVKALRKHPELLVEGNEDIRKRLTDALKQSFDEAQPVFKETFTDNAIPIDELTAQDMVPQAIWAQMEMRYRTIEEIVEGLTKHALHNDDIETEEEEEEDPDDSPYVESDASMEDEPSTSDASDDEPYGSDETASVGSEGSNAETAVTSDEAPSKGDSDEEMADDAELDDGSESDGDAESDEDFVADQMDEAVAEKMDMDEFLARQFSHSKNTPQAHGGNNADNGDGAVSDETVSDEDVAGQDEISSGEDVEQGEPDSDEDIAEQDEGSVDGQDTFGGDLEGEDFDEGHFDENPEESSESAPSDDQGSDDEEDRTIGRLKTSLLDDDDDDSGPQTQSQYERRVASLASQIAELEQENVRGRPWAQMGEVSKRDRPEDSLLQEDLDFEQSGRVLGVQVTEETNESLEDLIKRRILDGHYDDVVRRRAVDPNAVLPERFIELQDSQSSKSLAEIYEEDAMKQKKESEQKNTATPAGRSDAKYGPLKDEIETLFENISSHLDALSNARYTPKPPKGEITTISNLPSLSIESSLPSTMSTSAQLAPEEVHAPEHLSKDAADKTPADKRRERQKRRKSRKSENARASHLASMVGPGGRSVKRLKQAHFDDARKSLLNAKGVTVIGKGGQKAQPSSSASLKL